MSHADLDEITGRDQLPEIFHTVKSEQLSPVHKRDPAAEFFCLIHVVGGENDRRIVLVEHLDLVPDLPSGIGIEADGRFIQEKDKRTVNECPDDLKFALHTPGERAYRHISTVGKTCHGQEFHDPVREDVIRNVLEFSVELKIIVCRKLDIARVVLGTDTDDRPDQLRIPGDVIIVDECLARCRGKQGREDPDKGTFPCTI